MTAMPAPPRLLVTGSSGFIGSAILRAASAQGLECVGVCRRPHAMDGVLMRAGDIRNPRAMADAMRGVAIVIHTAGLAHSTRGVPIGAWADHNVVGTRVVLEAAAAAGVARVVHVSSVAVYGSHDAIVDEHAPCRPIGPYALSKYEGEREARRIASGAGLALCVARPATVAGADDPGSVARLARLLQRRRFIPLGDGRARKCLIGVNDVADACLRLALAPTPDTGTYNLAGSPVSLDDIVQALATTLAVPVPRVRVPQRVMEVALAACSRVGPRTPTLAAASRLLRAWLADDVYDVGRYEARYGPVAPTPWQTVLDDEARWLLAGVRDATRRVPA